MGKRALAFLVTAWLGFLVACSSADSPTPSDKSGNPGATTGGGGGAAGTGATAGGASGAGATGGGVTGTGASGGAAGTPGTGGAGASGGASHEGASWRASPTYWGRSPSVGRWDGYRFQTFRWP